MSSAESPPPLLPALPDPHNLDAVYHAAILAVLAGLPPRVVLRGELIVERAEPDPHRLAALKATELDILSDMVELMCRLWRVREEARTCWEEAIVKAAAAHPPQTKKRRRKS